MAMEPLPTAIQAEHLTDVLRRSGALGDGRVREVVVENARDTIVSHIKRLRLSYDGAASGPASLILKTGHPGRAGDGDQNAGRQEVAFYNQVAPAMRLGLVPRCFDAQWDEGTRAWHILLEDLSDTHFIATIWPLPPTDAQCGTIVDAWARFHAAWWDDPRFGVSIGVWPDTNSMERFLRDLTGRYTRFADLLGDRLTPERRDLLERLFDAAPRLLGRNRTRRHVTIAHRDAHVWNCFLPRDGSDDVRIFDWENWRIGLGPNDLAYMMATQWYPERRRRLERPLLDRYHAGLLANGVCGYDRRSLDDDYRWSVLWQITTPIWQATMDLPPMIWWSNLERTMLAVDDLDCRGLLSG